jgi:hypothetical protein
MSIAEKVTYVIGDGAGDPGAAIEAIAHADEVIANRDASRREERSSGEDVRAAHLDKSLWEFRVAYATQLRDLNTLSRATLSEKELGQIDRTNANRRAKMDRIIARPTPAVATDAVQLPAPQG